MRDVRFDMPPGAFSYQISLTDKTDTSQPVITITPLIDQEARELFFQIGEQMGYTWTHRTEKKPAPAEPTPQARQDIAATATLHGMGYRWSDTNQWWQPPKEEDGDTVAALRTRITVLTQQALQQDDTLQRNQTASQKMVTALSAIREALGMPYNLGVGGRVEDGVLEAVHDLQIECSTHRASLNRVSEVLGIERKDAGDHASGIVPAIQQLQRKAHEQDQAINGICSALGMSIKPYYSTDIVVYVRSQRDILAGVYEIMGVTPGACNLGPAIRDMKARETALTLDNAGAFAALRDHGYTPDRGETLGTLIRDAFGAEAAKLRLAKASADGWQKAAAKLREESTDSNSAWHRGHVVGYTSGSTAERERCTGIAQSAADRLDSAIALRIAQEIKNPA